METNNKFSTPAPDLTYLKGMVGDDQNVLKEIINIFLEEGPGMVASLKVATSGRDFDTIKKITHTLITELSTVGIVTAVNDVKRINKQCSEMKDLDTVVEGVVKTIEESMVMLKEMV